MSQTQVLRRTDPQAVRRQVVQSALHSMLILALCFALLIWVIDQAVDLIGSALTLRILLITGGSSFSLLAVSEVLVCIWYGAKPADRSKFPEFYRAVEELSAGRLFKRPRLYVLEMEGPNAVAFGLGFFGQYAIAVTEELYEMMSYEELKAVLAHELAHIKCKDVGLMTFLGIVTGGLQRLIETILGRTVGAISRYAFVPLLDWLVRVTIALFRGALSVEREYSADALASLFIGSPDPLISALTKLQDWRDAKAAEEAEKEDEVEGDKAAEEEDEATDDDNVTVEDALNAAEEPKQPVEAETTESDKPKMTEKASPTNPLADLFISHPKMGNRLAALNELAWKGE